MAPALSVVLPMRNASPWLPALLAALAREWATGFELIAIDDGSSDGSGALLANLCNHWPRERWQLLESAGHRRFDHHRFIRVLRMVLVVLPCKSIRARLVIRPTLVGVAQDGIGFIQTLHASGGCCAASFTSSLQLSVRVLPQCCPSIRRFDHLF